MNFRRRHPYLFWQIIGWAILLADFGFLVISAMEGFDDWCYPVIVFTFLAGLFIVAGTPVIIKLIKQKITPESDVNAQIQRRRLSQYSLWAVFWFFCSRRICSANMCISRWGSRCWF